MKSALAFNSFYISLPFFLSSGFVVAFFNLPLNYLVYMLGFVFVSCFFLAFDVFSLKNSKNFGAALSRALFISSESKGALVSKLAIYLSWFVVLACFADLFVNGLVILNAANYAEFSPLGRHVRHLSIMCWILVPVAFLCVKSRKVKVFFILAALIFPILFVDRNRFLQSSFCLFWFYIAFKPDHRVFTFKNIICVFLVLTLFGLVGVLRSGSDAFIVPSSGFDMYEGAFPLKNIFESLNVVYQQLILYVASPMVNFCTVAAIGFKDMSVLGTQLFSFLGFEESGIFVPVLVPRFNVGTEYFPFLMFSDYVLAYVAFLFVGFSLVASRKLFESYPNIFTFLIFTRIAYCCLMAGFAPQFYTWVNFWFIFLCLFIWGGSIILKSVVVQVD